MGGGSASLPALNARGLIDRFTSMVRNGQDSDLADWLDEAERSELASFARGLRNDESAVTAALSEPWSNG